VTVRVQELASAKRSADTQIDRDGRIDFGGDVGNLVRNMGGIDPDKLMNLRSGTSHDASGQTSRRDDVRFNVAATVTKVLPNGNLFLEGHRVVLVNDEEHHFYISGVARPADIETDNSIASIQLADAQVEFVGDGVMSEGQKPGWLTRVLNFINPL
jgi:flagellar L-ring protein precursor FlgH